jgi:hypothetical protein
LVGDWFEEDVAKPLLDAIATKLGLFADYKKRRPDRVVWEDSDGNGVDYDFVFELDGTEEHRGVPVAFFETFWRRGSRHSKDKARDDSGKLVYMRDTYPTARVLAIVAAGDFTGPAQALVRSRGIHLWYAEKRHVLEAWKAEGVIIDYDDKAAEAEKSKVASAAFAAIREDPSRRKRIAERFLELVSPKSVEAFQLQVHATLSAIPRRYVILRRDTSSYEFTELREVDAFFQNSSPEARQELTASFAYRVEFGDGDVFFRDELSWEAIKELHGQLRRLVDHMLALPSPT